MTACPRSLEPFLPEIRLYLADSLTDVWEAAERAAGTEVDPPFWAFAWAGGQAVARYLLDNPHLVRGRRVHDVASGGGIVAVAAALAGADTVTATDIDPAAVAAIRRNALLNDVRIDTRVEDATAAPPPDADVVTAGDVFYNRSLSASMLATLDRCAGATLVLAGDPERAYPPSTAEGHRTLISYDVPTTYDLESAGSKRTTVWLLRGSAANLPQDRLKLQQPGR